MFKGDMWLQQGLHMDTGEVLSCVVKLGMLNLLLVQEQSLDAYVKKQGCPCA
jgi:hypothetical protein